MLGSSDEVDDAVQEAWFRLSRADLGGPGPVPYDGLEPRAAG